MSTPDPLPLEDDMDVVTRTVSPSQIVQALTTLLIGAAVLWIFSTTQTQGEQLAEMRGAGHPFTAQDARALTNTLTEIQKSLARLEEHHEILRNR